MFLNTMKSLLFVGAVTLIASVPARADIASSDLPSGVQWYAHADLNEMKGSVTGKHILDFLEDEVFSELRDETGIDLGKDLQAATVYGRQGSEDGAMILYGRMSDENRTKIEALMEIYGDYEKETRKGIDVYSLVKRGRDPDASDDDSSDLFSDSRRTYLAFGKRDQTLITQSRGQLEDFVAAGGRMQGAARPGQAGSLLVLQADRSLVKAGMNAGAGLADDRDWDSSILRHMKQIAMVLADQSGKASLEAQLVTDSPELAESIRNIVQGLISIKSLDQSEDPEVLELLRSIRLDLAGATIKANMLIEPEMLRETMR